MVAAIAVCVLALWTAAGMATAGRSEELTSLISLERDGYLLGVYPPHTLAMVRISGERYTRAMFMGFEILNRYISGNNALKKRVPMTAPVLQFISETGDGFDIAFVLPRVLAGMEPDPVDQRIRLQHQGETFIAVRPFSGYATSEYAAQQIAVLKDLLERDGLPVSGSPAVAQFDPPWTPPFMRYNEIWWILDPSVALSLKPEERTKIEAARKAETSRTQPNPASSQVP